MSNLDFELLQKNIKALLRNNSITQRELAEIANMTQGNVSKALNANESKQFTLEQVYRIAQHFDVSIDSLVGNAKEKNPGISTRSIFALLVDLLCKAEIKTKHTVIKETVFSQFLNEHGYYDCDVEQKDIEYSLFYFPDYLRVADYADCDELEADVYNEFCQTGNESRFTTMNSLLKKIVPMIDLYRKHDIPDDAFHSILNGYLEQLSD